MATSIYYKDAAVRVRADIENAHDQAWAQFGVPGAFLSGRERIAIIGEMRASLSCHLCAQRKAALSPAMVQGTHDRASDILSAPAVDAVHRIVTDPGRLTESWFKGLMAQGLDEGAYVELTGVVIQAIVIETFDLAMGLHPRALPPVMAGAPSGFVPEGLTDEGAWVKTVPGDIGRRTLGSEIYYQPTARTGPHVSYVIRALSHVPEEFRSYMKLVAADYIPFPDIGNFPEYAKYKRAISPVQTEFISSRVSALNGCFY